MNTNENGATLMAHCGTTKISRDELSQVQTPPSTKTHKPISHHRIVNTLEEALSFRHLKVVRDEYAVSNDGMRMFGIMDLDAELLDSRFSIGLRNSNDKSMSLAMTAGYRVTVCDNMMFSGDFNPLSRKHTTNFELVDAIAIAVDRIQRSFDPIKNQIAYLKESMLNDNEARLFIYRAFMDDGVKGLPKSMMKKVHQHYFKPEYEEFEKRNLWSLSNAFTSSFKKFGAMRQFEMTARFGGFLTAIREELTTSSLYYVGAQRKDNDSSSVSDSDSWDEEFDSEIERIVDRLDKEEEQKARKAVA